MTFRFFMIMALLALLAFGAAAWTVINEPAPINVAQAEKPAFPALRDNPDAPVLVRVKGPEGDFELRRIEGDDWVVSNKYDYPADPGKLRSLVVRLSDMHLVEAKTKRPELHYRLEVEEPEGEEFESRGLQLIDAEGKVIVDAIFGQRHWRRTGAARNGIYFRYAGDDQAWLAGGGYTLDGDVVEWMDDTIVHHPREDVTAVEIQRADGVSYKITRQDAGAEFDLEGGFPARLPNVNALAKLGHGLNELRLKDVVPVADFSWPATGTDKAVFHLFAGYSVVLEFYKEGEGAWLRISADTSENDAAAKFNDRRGNWIYGFSPHAADRLAPTLQSLYERVGGS